jgi:signal transduction histidine kinase
MSLITQEKETSLQMADRSWRVLLVEDDKDDFILVKEMLNEARGKVYQLDWVSSYAAGRQAILTHQYHAILMDYELGPQSGLDLIRDVHANGCKAPIILFTGRGNYEIDVEAMQMGVTDYLSKSEVTPAVLERAIRYAILQKQTEEELRTARDELDLRVQERTRELTSKNLALEAEIAERQRVQAELNEVQRRLNDRDEAERTGLARELHDGPMQDLYGLTYQMETLPSDFAAGNGDETIRSIKSKILQVIQSLRSISRELRPPTLAPYGLEKAIRSHAETLQQGQPDLRFKLSLDADGQMLSESVRMVLFRIYQVAITNVIRHARATRVDVRLILEDSQVHLEVQDNGCGFPLPKRWIELARQDHLGLVGASERAEAAGGKLMVESEIGKGTLVRVTVPYKLQ